MGSAAEAGAGDPSSPRAPREVLVACGELGTGGGGGLLLGAPVGGGGGGGSPENALFAFASGGGGFPGDALFALASGGGGLNFFAAELPCVGEVELAPPAGVPEVAVEE